jgi:hypothetical protein
MLVQKPQEMERERRRLDGRILLKWILNGTSQFVRRLATGCTNHDGTLPVAGILLFIKSRFHLSKKKKLVSVLFGVQWNSKGVLHATSRTIQQGNGGNKKYNNCIKDNNGIKRRVAIMCSKVTVATWSNSVHTVATMCCTNVMKDATDRHGRVHKVFFA